MFAFLDPVLLATESLVAALADVLSPVLADNATAGAIAVVTLTVRLMLVPLSVRSLRAGAARAAVGPEERALRRQFARDPGRLRREIADLHRRRGISPWTGLAPALAQAPFFLLLYRLFSSPTIGGHANLLFTHTLFGLPLGSGLRDAVLAGYLPIYLGLFAVIGLAAFWSSRTARRTSADSELTAAAGMTSMVGRLLPYGSMVAAAFLPLAVGIYLAVVAWWTAAERHVGARLRLRASRARVA